MVAGNYLVHLGTWYFEGLGILLMSAIENQPTNFIQWPFQEPKLEVPNVRPM